MKQLTLYSRVGCCLCEGLESSLRDLDLKEFSIELAVIDIDAPDTPQELKARYDLQVPVLVLDGSELPRVSPRLTGEGLLNWLQRCLSTAL
ncbi:ribonucleotide reductase (class II) [Synechococcus sp. WH 8109]|uniref:glutaredoxin family protein n=1 Tax=Synechococcus sp. WH 8109 TaxID=166314 RepID=UPI0001B8E1B8|nr:glutaredoxin family protein [Synechococcus sp. WH 8109]AHF64278.1 ribonucleotide reductase (class II) [Synechococcus sp. WH 8109]